MRGEYRTQNGGETLCKPGKSRRCFPDSEASTELFAVFSRLTFHVSLSASMRPSLCRRKFVKLRTVAGDGRLERVLGRIRDVGQVGLTPQVADM